LNKKEELSSWTDRPLTRRKKKGIPRSTSKVEMKANGPRDLKRKQMVLGTLKESKLESIRIDNI
jgi:hypothetical protein